MSTATIVVRPSLRGRLLSPVQFGRLYKQALRELASEAELIFSAYAPKASGRLSRNIRTVPKPDGFEMIAEARDPQTGYDYVGVTRFGHKGIIVPRADRRAATVVATGGARGQGSKASLRFVMNGRVVYRKSTKGYHPTSDWVEDAQPAIGQRAEKVMGRLARRIEVVR